MCGQEGHLRAPRDEKVPSKEPGERSFAAHAKVLRWQGVGWQSKGKEKGSRSGQGWASGCAKLGFIGRSLEDFHQAVL